MGRLPTPVTAAERRPEERRTERPAAPHLRPLARAVVALFVLSTVFPLAAGVLGPADPTRPAGLAVGVADVAVAALLVGASGVLLVRAHAHVTDAHRARAQRWTERLVGLVPALLAFWYLAGEHLAGEVLAGGLAWRAWLAVLVLPSLATALHAGGGSHVRW